MNVFDLFAKISIDTSEYESGLSEASNKTSGFGEKLQSIGSAVSSVGSSMTKSVTLPIAGLGTAIIKTGMDYEAGMSKVQAISGATGKEMDMLGAKAMEMAAKTKFSTADSAEAYQYMAMAGWDAGQMVDGLTGIMNLAAASGENLGATSDIVTDALTAFGLEAADSARFADVLAAASNSANTNVSMLGESFKYVAPVAGAMGYSVEDVSVALGLMANSGIKATQAGTTLRTAITNMASPTKNMAAVMEEYGISLTDADGKMLSFAEIMQVLRERMGGLDESTQAAAASALFGKEAMSGMLAIINASADDFSKLTEAINSSSDAFVKTKDGSIIPMSQALAEGIEWIEEYNGTTEKMAATMQDNAEGAFDRLKSAADVLFTQLSTYLIPGFTAVVETVTSAVNWFGSLDAGMQKTIITIAGIAAAVGPLLVILGNIISAVGKISSGISSLIGFVQNAGSAFSGLFAILSANPIAAVIVVVAALTAGIITLWKTNEDFRNAVGPIWESIKGFFVGAWKTAKETWGNAKEFFSGIWTDIKEKGSDAIEKVKRKFVDGWQEIKSAWSNAKGFFSEKWEDIKGVFSGAKEKFKEVGKNIVSGIESGLSNTKSLKEKASNVVNSVKSIFTGKKGFDIHSPSKWSEWVFDNVVKGGEIGLENRAISLIRDVDSISDRIKDGLNFGTANVGLSYSGLSDNYAGGAAPLAGNQNAETARHPVVINLTAQSVLNGKVIGETAYQYMLDRDRLYGGR